MNTGLFEGLTGTYSDNTKIDNVPESQRKIKSIMDHLRRLFNCRSGSMPHLADYGIPDLSELHRSTPEGTKHLQNAIKKTVEKYEKRLKNVRIELIELNGGDSRISYILTAEIINGSEVKFHTTLFTSHPPEVIQCKKKG